MFSIAGIVVASVALSTACAPPSPAGTTTAPTARSTPSSGPSQTGRAPQPLGVVWPEPPEGEVIAPGTVLEVDDVVVLCLGAVAESAPPQCGGLPIDGWSWDGLAAQQAADARWGTYAVQGTYDGERLTVTQAPEPFTATTPASDVVVPGDPTRERLTEVWQQIVDRLGTRTLSTSIHPEYVEVHVVWDDGTLQAAADEEFGEDVVVVRSALREVEA